MNLEPAKVWEKYTEGVRYKETIDLYNTVEQNENFFVGRQWGELENSARDYDLTVINFLQRVVSYFVSNVTTDAIGIKTRFFNMPKEASKRLETILAAQIDQAVELNDLNGKSKDAVRDSAVDGDACYHNFFDATAASGQMAEGLVKTERIPNTDVYFGNRQNVDVEDQPYIIIASRKLLSEVKEIAERMGGNKNEVQEDSGEYESSLQQKDDAKRVTMLTYYFKKNGTVHRFICTQSAVISPATDLGYKLYPIAWMPWEPQKGSYHGVSCVTALIPNQIAINKAFAMALKQHRDVALRKIIYNRLMFPNGWSSRASSIGVDGDPREVVLDLTPSADVPASVFTMIDSLLANSREMMGASDASLGNINPDNTSAIIAVQNATAMPLEMKKRQYRQMLEKVVRSWLDIMTVTYGVRDILISDELGREEMVSFDWGLVRDTLMTLSVDVGDANYWDPNTQATMLERLLQSGIITDPVMFMDHMPDGLLTDKERLLAEMKEAQKNAMSQMQGANTAVEATGAGNGLPMPQMPQGI